MLIPRSLTLTLGLALTTVLVVYLAATPRADAARDLEVGFVADQFGSDLLTNQNANVRDKWWDRLDKTNSELARVNLYWNQVAGPAEPADPTSPADPSYDWTIPDSAVRAAEARGITVAFTVVGAPRWAEGKNPPPEGEYRVGSWKPKAAMFGDFAVAAATRYSGSFDDLPRVRYWEAWNEPNLPRYLEPQWKGKKPKSPSLYRDLLNAFYEGVHSVDDSNQVVAAGTSPFGDKRGGKRMRPYYFWREVLCLKDRKKLKKKGGCASGDDRAHMDIYAHNPINAVKGEGPTSPSPNPDDGVPSNFAELGRIVAKAEKRKTVLPKANGRPGWATETWYESNPPDPKAVSLKKQARFSQQALYVLWQQGAEAAFFLQMRDSKYDPEAPGLLGFQTGVYLFNNKAKPALDAVRFPFVADRKSDEKVLLWGKAPESGRLKVTQRGSGPKKVASFRVKAGRVFTKKVSLEKTGNKHQLTAKVGGESSLKWSQR